MIARATNFDMKGVAPNRPDKPAFAPGSRSVIITTGISGHAA